MPDPVSAQPQRGTRDFGPRPDRSCADRQPNPGGASASKSTRRVTGSGDVDRADMLRQSGERAIHETGSDQLGRGRIGRRRRSFTSSTQGAPTEPGEPERYSYPMSLPTRAKYRRIVQHGPRRLQTGTAPLRESLVQPRRVDAASTKAVRARGHADPYCVIARSAISWAALRRSPSAVARNAPCPEKAAARDDARRDPPAPRWHRRTLPQLRQECAAAAELHHGHASGPKPACGVACSCASARWRRHDARPRIEFLQFHAHLHHARVGEQHRRNPFRQRSTRAT